MFSSLTAIAVNALMLGVPLPMDVFGCDEANQALSIVSAHEQGGWNAGSAVAQQLTSTKNAKGDASCGRMQIVAVPMEVMYTSKLVFPDGERTVNIVAIRQESTGDVYYALTLDVSFIKAGLAI